MYTAILIVYGLLLTFILLYSLVQLAMLIRYWRAQKQDEESCPVPDHWPLVTVQLPVYNERYVAERLIRQVCALDYPREKLQIQVLDDSTDETRDIIVRVVGEMCEAGYRVVRVTRPRREGFKAGALACGLQQAAGNFVAIFDADFMPDASFLKRVMPWFHNPKTGMVQTRWGHLNRDFSLLTRLQAFGLDAHFTVEQVGRNAGNHFINFNGTAGVWRKECIEDAGGWHSDTLTEDLDLSYRAQLKGWRFKYLEQVETPAELPVNIYPLKSQQFRWTKGAAECFRKNLGAVLRAPLPLSTKFHAFFHLSNSFLFVAILVTALLSFPVLVIKQSAPQFSLLFQLGGVFLLSLLVLIMVYYTTFRVRFPGKNRHFWWQFPLFLSVSMGLSLHNALAVLEGYFGVRSPFVRTPKFNSVGKKLETEGLKQYVRSSLSGLLLFEFLLFLYFALALVYGVIHGELGLLPFHLMLTFGFGYISLMALSYHIRALSFRQA